jgi:DNA modification methylase
MTELVWEGKYDKDGRKSAPLRVALPFQTVETVNESAADRQRTLSLFTEGRPTDWRNRLIWGDKRYVLPSLLPELAGKVNLIYIDPPFDTGADFSFPVEVDGDEFTKEPSLIEQKAYRDTWGRGLDSYLQWFYETVTLLYELLHEIGSLYVHLDWRMVHYAKAVIDEVFGVENHRNDIRWRRQPVRGGKATSNQYARNSDTILFYSRSTSWCWNGAYKSYDEDFIKAKFRPDPKGRLFRDCDLGNYSEESIREFERQGRIYITSRGKKRLIRYLDEEKGESLGDIWTDIAEVNSMAEERTSYPTQKPEALLERIIKASSNEGDLVLDCFCGSGTTAAVAEKLGRRWIACDLSRFAIHTTRKRLLGIPNVRPFVVQNLGKYERQAWQAGEFGGGDGTEQAAARQRAYTEFILKLYNARAINGYMWLHGVKGGRMIHVGAVDAPVSVGDVTNIAAEFRRAIGTGKDAPKTNGVDVLGWDFAFELNEVAKQQAAAANINVRFLRIPRDVMDKRAVEQGDIRFFELAALSVEVKRKGREVTLTLNDFVIPPDDVPEDVRQAVKHWEQWIDYWAVDWDNKGDTFHNEWQSYRTRKDKALQKQVAHSYPEAGEYAIVVKVIDILGNDTTKTLKVRV